MEIWLIVATALFVIGLGVTAYARRIHVPMQYPGMPPHEVAQAEMLARRKAGLTGLGIVLILCGLCCYPSMEGRNYYH